MAAWPSLSHVPSDHAQRAKAVCAGLACAVVYLLIRAPGTQYDEHARLAWALLHGHPWIDATPVWEQVKYRGHAYILHPPLPAFLLIPFVAIWNARTDCVLIECAIGALGVGLCYRLTRSWWLTAFLACGTVYGYEATLGASWGFCLILSCVPTLGALIVLTEGGSGWLIGLLGGTAALARYDLALVIPVYALWRRDWRVLAGALPALAVYVGFNYWRYGTLHDPTLWLWYATDAAATPGHGPFSIFYLSQNLYSALCLAPKLSHAWPFLIPQVSGQSILLTSPALLCALNAPWQSRTTRLLWLCTILTLAPSLTVYANGAEQFGWRYAIQAYPFLLLLMARARIDQLMRVLIVLSVLLVTWGIYVIRVWGA